MKFILLDSTSYWSLELIVCSSIPPISFVCSVLPETRLWYTFCQWILWTTSFRFYDEDAWCIVNKFSPILKSFLLCWTLSIISLRQIAIMTCCLTFSAVPIFPFSWVWCGCPNHCIFWICQSLAIERHVALGIEEPPKIFWVGAGHFPYVFHMLWKWCHTWSLVKFGRVTIQTTGPRFLSYWVKNSRSMLCCQSIISYLIIDVLLFTFFFESCHLSFFFFGF